MSNSYFRPAQGRALGKTGCPILPCYDPISRWLLALRARRGEARTIVALANKLARIGWAVLRGEQDFDVNKAFRPKAVKQQSAAAA